MLVDAPSILTYVRFFSRLNLPFYFLSAVRAILSTYSFSTFRTQCVGNLSYKHRCNRLLLSHRVRSPCHSFACSIYLYFLKRINRHRKGTFFNTIHTPIVTQLRNISVIAYLFFNYFYCFTLRHIVSPLPCNLKLFYQVVRNAMLTAFLCSLCLVHPPVFLSDNNCKPYSHHKSAFGILPLNNPFHLPYIPLRSFFITSFWLQSKQI